MSENFYVDVGTLLSLWSVYRVQKERNLEFLQAFGNASSSVVKSIFVNHEKLLRLCTGMTNHQEFLMVHRVSSDLIAGNF